jgi:Family of unknown function (DUF7003)
MTDYTEDDILGALDDAQDGEGWPDFEHLDYEILAARLTAFRDDERWAIVFSMIQWEPASDSGIVVMTEPIGNCIELPDDDEYLARRIDTVALEIDADDDALADVGYISDVRLRGKAIPVSRLTIAPDPEVEREEAFWVALAAASQYREQMLPNDEELARFFPDGAPPKFLVLDDWHHSKYGLAREWELFRLLAKAIVKGDPSLYQPTEPPNTNWRNWIEK